MWKPKTLFLKNRVAKKIKDVKNYIYLVTLFLTNKHISSIHICYNCIEKLCIYKTLWFNCKTFCVRYFIHSRNVADCCEKKNIAFFPIFLFIWDITNVAIYVTNARHGLCIFPNTNSIVDISQVSSKSILCCRVYSFCGIFELSA